MKGYNELCETKLREIINEFNNGRFRNPKSFLPKDPYAIILHPGYSGSKKFR
jgi:hypothetical protein